MTSLQFLLFGLLLLTPTAPRAQTYQDAFSYARDLLKQQQYGPALDAARQAIHLDSSNWDAWYVAGAAAIGLQKSDLALDYLQEALTRAPESAKATVKAALASCHALATSSQVALPYTPTQAALPASSGTNTGPPSAGPAAEASPDAARTNWAIWDDPHGLEWAMPVESDAGGFRFVPQVPLPKAAEYCSILVLAGASGWRLSSAEEASHLWKEGRAGWNALVSLARGASLNEYAWTSTENKKGQHIGVSLEYGGPHSDPDSFPKTVLCVRNLPLSGPGEERDESERNREN